jgi:hypothetical protein
VKNLELTQEDRARIADSKHKIQSVTNNLHHVDPGKIPGLDEIQDCLESADETLKGVLRGEPNKKI